MKHLVILVALLLAACGTPLDEKPADKLAGYTACQMQVEAGLKSPATVQWPPIKTTLDRFTSISPKEGLSAEISVDGYVHAANMFGGMTKQRFFCAVKCKSGETSSCRLLDFEFF